MPRPFALLGLLLLALLPLRAAALPSAELCEWAAGQAAAESGVPAEILGALTLTESGRRLEGTVRPWAWSANAEGEGTWFDDPASAIAFAQDRVAQGRINIDIGCFQLNYRWHGGHFSSVAQMFDPLENARYAARFLRQLHGETGDWRLAAGAFHSRTPVHAQRYLARFDTLHQMLRQAGFSGMAGSVETYNSFAAIDSGQRSRVRQRVMLLGAPLGSPPSGRPGSLAVLSTGQSPLGAGAGPMIALAPAGAAGPRASLWHPRAPP
ncbi:hypothetical protein SAMN05421641_10597 [Paracoccus thiocyanatus]|uniref:Transglycosylase SLT domain-containing protein n=1 Tax=Paracoccus thiocyanatus TaxID=34006 RepID=A0A1N6R8K2_9RHOB|nr:lytic transglycosylase domain-containing protein [Paracoccus thiocyanatus]SIQ25210.1 hypothetical protein SAMN05421641_10597 [Paracoccus thiocyanatus]